MRITGLALVPPPTAADLPQMADGQESSTRYITMDASQVPSAEELGVPEDLADRWRSVIARSFAAYHAEYARLDALATAEPERVRLPADAKPAVVTRLRKNYALDRARYFIPLATRTNVGLVQTSRMWAQTGKHLDSLPQPEARASRRRASRMRSGCESTGPRRRSSPRSRACPRRCVTAVTATVIRVWRRGGCG